jgi:hypothetical protein
MDRTLDDIIDEQCYFEDSALEDAIAYAQKIISNADKFKKEKQDDKIYTDSKR